LGNSRRSVAYLLGFLMALTFLPTQGASGVVIFKVTRFNDPAPGACLANDCSFREAVMAANGTAGADLIKAPAGIYTLSITGTGGASQGDLDITDDVTIQKTGTGKAATVDGSGQVTTDRVFEIAGADVVFKKIGARDGVAPVPGGGAATDPRFGGGIRVNAGASLKMVGGNVTDNHAPNTASVGGGIWNAGQLILNKVVVQINETDFGFAGGIWTESGGTTIVNRSAVRDNTSGFGGGFSGGGLTNVKESLVRGNDAGLGGAFYVAGGTFNVRASTISDNQTPDRGGAARARNGTINFFNSTISENIAGIDGGALAAQDDAGAPPTEVFLKNSVVAENVDQDQAGTTGQKPDCYDQTGGLFQSGGGNIVGNTNGCAITPQANDELGTAVNPVNPQLFPLRFNGGPLRSSLTYALRTGGPAVNNGAGCEPKDQRGVPRKLDQPCDSGSYARVKCLGVLVNRVGTDKPDKSVGPMQPSGQPDGIFALGGGDRLKGAGAADGLCGATGDDKLEGGPGADSIRGAPGADVLEGGDGNDRLEGAGGKDTLRGGQGNDTCIGGGGVDTATGCEITTGVP